MKTLVKKFTNQLQEALSIGEKFQIPNPKPQIQNVLVTGLGGSGIGGTIVAELVSAQATVPINVNKDYFLPDYVDENTLVIVSSYSGNTEETLNALEIALQKKAKIVCVTSGGKVLEIAKKNNFPHIVIPSGMPPRACFGYSFTQLFFILHTCNIISDDFKKQLNDAVSLLNKEEENIQTEAKRIAEKLFKKIPIVYAAAGFEGVAIRFRQQINENGKMLCWHHVIPEMNHNELVGWTEKNENLAVVILRNATDYSRTQTRIAINKEIISKYTSTLLEIYSKGNSTIERVLYLIHLCDWVSVFLAELKQIDATEVNVINYLKDSLAKI